MTAPMTTAPNKEPDREPGTAPDGGEPGTDRPDARESHEHQDPFDHDALPTPRAPPRRSCVPSSPRSRPVWW